MYWLENIDGRVIREYPDGHTEKADEEETALMQWAVVAAPLMRVSGRNPWGSRRAEENRNPR